MEVRRQWLRRALLEKRLPISAVDEALEHHGAVHHPAQGAFDDALVVAHDVELGIALLRKEDLVRVADRDFVRAGLQRQRGGRHKASIITQQPHAEWRRGMLMDFAAAPALLVTSSLRKMERRWARTVPSEID